MGWGPFSSDSKSSTTTTTQNAGFSEIGGSATSLNITGGGKKSRQDISVNMLDGGAIKDSFAFASGVTGEALKQVELAGTRASSALTEAVKAVSESNRAETENVWREALKWGVIALLGWGALRAVRG